MDIVETFSSPTLIIICNRRSLAIHALALDIGADAILTDRAHVRRRIARTSLTARSSNLAGKILTAVAGQHADVEKITPFRDF